jgi:hypothetical protein
MSLMALVVFSCAATAAPCLPDRADVYAEPLPEAACRSLPAVMAVASWARENPDRRVVRWACVAPPDLKHLIDQVLGMET